MSQDSRHVVIAGAGHAGGSAAAMLRQLGWQGAITLVGEEPIPPYQRPPLSKAWLKGEATTESLLLRPAHFYPDAGIDLRPGTRVTAIDRAAKAVTLSDGAALSYDFLILALGARARRLPLPGRDLGRVLELRTVADADQLKAVLHPDARLAVIGGGYIGLEAAASARALGAEVVVIERESRVLARVAGPILSNFFQDYHRGQGVAIETDAQVIELDAADGTVAGVRLGDGRVIPCDATLIGVGVVANEALARDAGLGCDNGIIVDLAARTDDPAIFAVGDCTNRPLPLYGRMARLESVPNALEQARQAASQICGKPPPAPEVPWFWSDQYDLRLQIAGLPFDATETVVRGDIPGAKFALFHLAADGTVRAVEAVNASTEFMGGRRIIARGKRLSRRRIEDMSVSMQELAA
ncbi:NAD(P)/FAD-dependent oxidoreductase [Rhodopila globiformis]|uniref:Ferredoxin reductase n=1 Tax=Rhodopila globiformis TaxID=1071 RepID=A0A2S6MTS7_RHOGL|nr:FAD-dependent oxidoreductase [Rhodopila globiformis]PPQ25767.1 ferredoxin reductase [Rhodopila globiformis]